MENLDLQYLCTVIGNLSGVPIRLYDGETLKFSYSFVRLPKDPVELYREDISGEVIFAAELIGVEVFCNGEKLGEITDVLDYPGNSVYVVKGEHEYMIPAVSQFILSTDMDANRMEVRLIEGMRTDEN